MAFCHHICTYIARHLIPSRESLLIYVKWPTSRVIKTPVPEAPKLRTLESTLVHDTIEAAGGDRSLYVVGLLNALKQCRRNSFRTAYKPAPMKLGLISMHLWNPGSIRWNGMTPLTQTLMAPRSIPNADGQGNSFVTLR